MPVPDPLVAVSFQLPHISSWSHRFATEVLACGDLAVDLTAGRGRDTLALYQAVGERGCVVAFDIQKTALEATAGLLNEQGATVEFCLESGGIHASAHGAWLVHADHAHLSRYLPRSPRAVIANLGYLPGGDASVVTSPASTRMALEASLAALSAGGRLVCVVYTAHAGGAEEALAVEQLLHGLSSRVWFVLRLQVANREQAPYLLLAEKRR